jgi:MFS superfamily sulfate permease-like transporter
MVNWLRERVRFDRNELAGSFGDIGTDLPLIVGMILAVGLDGASTFIVFGATQILMGLIYGLPMPIQPLKAMAVIVISQKIAPDVLYGGGLAIGIIMLALALTGLLTRLADFIPRSVVRGLQLGLGLNLATLALKNYVPADGTGGMVLAAAAFLVTILLLGNRKCPAALLLVLLGAVYAAVFHLDFARLGQGVGLALPAPHVPTAEDVLQGFWVLALPQLALSIGNSVIATRQTIHDLFPGRTVTVRRIGLTYALMNMVQPFLSGIPTCHGAGGLAGYYAFGGRTGGSVIIYGSLYVVVGLCFSQGLSEAIKVFPLPILGVILLFEGLALMGFVREVAASKSDLTVCLLVALAAIGLPQGYLIGLVGGTLVAWLIRRGLVLRG